MAIIVTPLITGKSTGVESTSFVTSAYSLAANTLGILSIGFREAIGDLTIDGGGTTWVFVGGAVGSADVRLAVYRAMSTAGLSNVQSTIRLSNPLSAGSDAIAWSIVQYGNVSTASTDGAGAIGNSTDAAGTTANSTLSFDLSAGVGNLVLGVFAQGSSASWTTGASYTQIHSLSAESTGVAGASTAISLLVERQVNTTVVSAVGVSSAFKAARGVEVLETTVSDNRLRKTMMGVGR